MKILSNSSFLILLQKLYSFKKIYIFFYEQNYKILLWISQFELVSRSCRISVTGTHTDFLYVSESLIAVGHV